VTNAPADLLGARARIQSRTGLINPADVGIVGDGAHARTGGYHEGKDVLVSIGRYHPGISNVSAEDYSARLARDRNGLTNSASAMDIGDDWPKGGRAAWLRFNNLLVHALQAGDPALAAVRAINFSRDGVERKRIDREHGFGEIDDSTDSVTIHTHIEWYRDTEGRRQAGLDRLDALIAAAIANQPPPKGDNDMAFFDDPNAEKLAWRVDALFAGSDAVRGGPEKGQPMQAMKVLHDVHTVLDTLTGPAPATVDLDALAAKVAALVPHPPTAAEVADELQRRLQG
jgi:hypothetical protein